MHAILDCRLALALLSWAPALRQAGVVRLEHYSIYRPQARTQREGRVSGHARGLAIDAARFHLDNGEVLDVLTDWEDRERGSAPCPRRPDESWPSRLLRGRRVPGRGTATSSRWCSRRTTTARTRTTCTSKSSPTSPGRTSAETAPRAPARE